MLASCLKKNLLEAGCDEAGRGCLAGPVTAAAVILPKGFDHPLLNDSKQLSAKVREQLRPVIEQEAVAWHVQHIMPDEIDRINILRASHLAMELSVRELKPQPEFLLIDGNRFYTTLDIPFECIIKGDGKFQSIAAASILAKTHRDEYMHNLDLEHPEYGWTQNMGYPTKSHRAGILKYGATDWHRKSFQLLPKQLELPL